MFSKTKTFYKILVSLFFLLAFIGNIFAAEATNSSENKLLGLFPLQLTKNFKPIASGRNSAKCVSIPYSDLSSTSPSTHPDFLDCSGVSWTEAFDEMHEKISKEYAFTVWRGIDWSGLRAQYEPIIAAAEKNHHDETAYYQALRGYITSIHDAHVAILPINTLNKPMSNKLSTDFIEDQLEKHIGGSYGFIITQTDDGKFIVSYLSENGSANDAGIKLGDEVVRWNGVPIAQAIEKEPITWSDEWDGGSGNSFSPATSAGVLYEKIRLLTRDTIGNHATITVLNPSTKYSTVTLDALDDQMQTLNLTELYIGTDPENPVSYSISPNGLGYLKITSEDLNDGEFQEVIYVVNFFVDSKVPGVIIDLRCNIGGEGKTAANLAGIFYSGQQKKVSEWTTYYNKNTGKYESPPGKPPTYVVPKQPNYVGQVVILTNLGTVSGGEDMPMVLKNQPNVHILSFDPNTHGSFGGLSYLIIMPGNFPAGNYLISYPIERSLDKDGNIQVDANAQLQGGVATDVKIPMDAATAIDIYTPPGKDMALAYAENYLQNLCWPH